MLTALNKKLVHRQVLALALAQVQVQVQVQVRVLAQVLALALALAQVLALARASALAWEVTMVPAPRLASLRSTTVHRQPCKLR